MRFYAELADFLAPEHRGREFTHECISGRSVKDLIEGLGVPHTEVDLVLLNGQSVSFDEKIVSGDRLSVYPVFEGIDISPVSKVRPHPLRVPRFAVDVHLGGLAGYLRLCGFDTLYRNDWDDSTLVKTSVKEGMIILTRDRGLLKRAVVTHGYLVRARIPRKQLEEVLDRFDLWGQLKPLRRCSVCNGQIAEVPKAEVAAQLPRKTARYYSDFWRCEACGRVYWQGAHYRSLCGLFRRASDIDGGEAPAREQRDAD